MPSQSRLLLRASPAADNSSREDRGESERCQVPSVTWPGCLGHGWAHSRCRWGVWGIVLLGLPAPLPRDLGGQLSCWAFVKEEKGICWC